MEVWRQDEATSLARKYNNMVLGGKVRAVVRMATNKGAGRPFHPQDLDSKSRCPVIDVFRDTHPDCCVPSDEDFEAYPDAANQLDTMPVYCYER